VVDKGGDTFTVNDMFTVGESEEISPWMLLIKSVGLFDGQASPGILDHEIPLFYRGRGVAAFGIDLGMTNLQVGRANFLAAIFTFSRLRKSCLRHCHESGTISLLKLSIDRIESAFEFWQVNSLKKKERFA
jgi:hypothetical protein